VSVAEYPRRVDPYAWELRLDEALAVALLSAGYLLAVRFHPAPRWRKAAFAAAMLLLVVAFETPLETIGLNYLLTGHLLQNVILAEWAPALAVLALPPALARACARPRAVRVLTHPFVALPLWIGVYGAWHVPAVYDYALRHPDSLLHLEHASYFATGALMWWPVLQEAPHRLPSGARTGYLFAAFVLASPIGLLLALVGRPVYGFYAGAPERLWGLSRLADQQVAGLTMASEQAVVFFAVFALYFFRFFADEERLAVTSDRR
jgi:cytochrome c oxidase assembly factor CtaG